MARPCYAKFYLRRHKIYRIRTKAYHQARASLIRAATKSVYD
ncbi:hypothetical protein CAMGR0001_2571 [Campylobacter gracilis RM3268]|uniref:Uncharacterized protein n=1 Tax=Campylobacter gracilis RM3268 TaxID=553220 RepID=C8PET2_9BACT|nr:hypothetical protein CAMGR0001_2571 [Campylobacter gracilis RM3268]